MAQYTTLLWPLYSNDVYYNSTPSSSLTLNTQSTYSSTLQMNTDNDLDAYKNKLLTVDKTSGNEAHN